MEKPSGVTLTVEIWQASDRDHGNHVYIAHTHGLAGSGIGRERIPGRICFEACKQGGNSQV